MTPEWERAARSGDAATLERLAAAGADVDSLDQHGQTALMLAARAGHAEAVRALCRLGADLNHSAKYSLTAIMLGVINGHLEVTRILAAAGADLTTRGSGAPGFAGRSALDLAHERGDAEVVAVLRGFGKERS